jgi:hypothetical protein
MLNRKFKATAKAPLSREQTIEQMVGFVRMVFRMLEV